MIIIIIFIFEVINVSNIIIIDTRRLDSAVKTDFYAFNK